MISNTTQQIRNPYIQQMRESLAAQNLSSADCLILSHHDEVLIRRLNPVTNSLNSLVLQISQADWQFGESDLAAAIGWAIREAGVCSLYICGHSFGLSKNPLEHGYRFSEPSKSSEEKEAFSDRLWVLGRLMDNQNRLQAAKNHFADQVDQMLELPVVHEAVWNSELECHALFFLVQTGTFLTYDPNSDQFTPLIPSDNRI